MAEMTPRGSRSDSTVSSHRESGKGRDGDKLRWRLCGSAGFDSKKDVAWRCAGLGVGVSDSAVVSILVNIEVESASSWFAMVTALSIVSSQSAGDAGSQGWDASSS